MRQGKQNQHDKIEYMGCMQNADPILCPLSALAFYFFHHWSRDDAEKFSSFQQPEDYYNQYVFSGSVKIPEQPLSYPTQHEWNKKMFQNVKIHSKEITHAPHKQSPQHAELNGVKEAQIRRAGCWNTDAMTDQQSNQSIRQAGILRYLLMQCNAMQQQESISAIYLVPSCDWLQVFQKKERATFFLMHRKCQMRIFVQRYGLRLIFGFIIWKPIILIRQIIRLSGLILQVQDFCIFFVRLG